MTRALAATLVGVFALVCSSLAQTGGGRLQIAWIDVEGGASTLFVAPNGQSLLFDTGFPGNGDRDAKRIAAAANAMRLTRIDHVVISHWHGDHVGGLPALSKLISIGTFYDHGDGVEQTDRPLYEGYKALAGTHRHIVKPGETIALGDVRARILVAEGPVIANAVNGGTANPLCANAVRQEPAPPENIRMVGLAINYGPVFKMATLGDADWSRELELACPVNKLGHINLYTMNRHGSLDNSGAPALLGAIQPQVIVVNNGPRKGLGQKVDVKYITRQGETPAPYELNSYLRLAKLPGIEGIWQLHRSLLDADPAHNTMPDMIANLEEAAADQAYTITAAVAADGTFTVTNSRNGFSKTYRSR